MLQPGTAQGAQHGDLGIAVFQQPFGGVVGVGVIFDVWQHNGIAVGIRLRGRIKIPHDQIRVHTQAIGIAVAGIAGYYKAAGAAVALHSCIDRHGRKQDRVFHYFSHSFLALASSYMAR